MPLFRTEQVNEVLDVQPTARAVDLVVDNPVVDDRGELHIRLTRAERDRLIEILEESRR